VAFDTLHEFIAELDRRGELRRVGEPIDPVLEMAEIADRVVKAGGPALLFERPKGYQIPVVMNLFGSMRRMAWALRVEEIEQVARRIDELVHLAPPETLAGKVKMLPRLARLAAAAPRLVRSGHCQEVIEEEPRLDRLPILQCWPGDGGRFVTLPMVFTRHPETKARNVGMYRMQVFDERTTGMHWHLHRGGAKHYFEYERRGEEMPVAVALGGDPALIYAATAPVPEDMDEVTFAGYLRGRAVDMVKCRSNDLEVPAGAEIVIEGHVHPRERRREGPFGDHTGYYSAADDYPVFHVDCLTRRSDAIYPATIVGRPPMEDCYLGKATERIFLPLLRTQLPEVVDLELPVEGIFHNLAIVSIRKRYPGHARKVMHALWGLGQAAFTKIIIVVDEDVNVHDRGEVIWRVGNHIDPERDVTFVRGPVDVLNFASDQPNYGSKMGIDATRKWPKEGFAREWPEAIEMSPEVKRRVDDLWGRLGL
jgi:4-hydroxy-3-polyprenylbenzoate decarboxylase